MKINKGGNTGKRLFSSDKPSVIRLRYTLPVLFVVLLIFLKLPLLSIYFETVRLIITLAPMAAIVAVACYAFYHSHRGEKPNRLGYYLLILKILIAILAFYILYAPGEFFAFFQSLLGFAGSVFTLEGLIFLSGPIAVISFLLFAGLLGYRSYQAKQGTYTGSITKLFKRLSFTLFFLFMALGSTIVMASPSAIKPMTDYLGDTIFTLSGGHIQVLKGTDVSQYKRLLSLKEMTSSLSTSLVDTSKNFSEAIEENKTVFKEDLSQSAQELASSISETTEDLKDKLEEDIDDKLPLGGGTLSGKLTIGKDLTVRGETEFEDTVNANDILPNTNDSYDLGSAVSSFTII
ncbi:hypothetical protein [Desulfatiglans anilini]|uniref:hypothetical protein n=1 Tax=Desulfatiglans anilini TaxID=90728 RepID=UPI000485ACF2|nr:hypothetical protein [Desulfatiglans anilini]